MDFLVPLFPTCIHCPLSHASLEAFLTCTSLSHGQWGTAWKMIDLLFSSSLWVSQKREEGSGGWRTTSSASSSSPRTKFKNRRIFSSRSRRDLSIEPISSPIGSANPSIKSPDQKSVVVVPRRLFHPLWEGRCRVFPIVEITPSTSNQ